ncbi:peptidoglycan D,D-transpeptidase FtsI family protein [Legionella jordanis]|uniref:Peptidoglycan D,D-transpeptidase FtsI n=1 Tax=Legionella jordanis TaxID=456 RepID=A0A0W0V8I8_9GAMM|nr:penicillin-binding transpeptidase domain-containing protein [Legionella jordanis]KTD16446.1 peptidoglycan synthetase FtsI precursor [Legionella jordanis]RMX04002.1 penicillin-binding protein 2 [Legionella jordanis]RMX15291.1 penicillin-binding protein 2 [Legionella jordanis]VEH12094.1 cell division protein FtsI [Legionella jordanis]HAT8712605.1 penicillin-binding protein 2 [Legionella jordanis]
MKERNIKARLLVVAIFFILLLLALLWRMVDLTVLHRQFLKVQGDARSVRVVDVPAHRGIISDRQGTALAVSTPVESVWVNPKAFSPTPEQLLELSKLLQLTPKTLVGRVKNANGREFLYLRRQLTPMVAKRIEQLKIPGVNFQQEFKRYYPAGACVAQLLGFTNIDDRGIEGLELAYQDWLMGINGKKKVLKDRTGRIIEELGVLKEPRPGNPLVLSIDSRIQYLAYNELVHTIDKFSAKSGSVVVIDAKNGEILAAANAPSFNPNARGLYSRDSYRNKAITDTFEPGSVIKPFSIASALGSGLFAPDTIIDTRPSWMIVHGHTIRDVHNYGVLDVTGVLQHSSNVGVTKMILQSPPEQLIGLLQRSGFGQRTESGYPGESEGAIVNAKDANPFVLATLSFGYGLSVSALQLAKGYLIFANKGRSMPVTLIHNQPLTPGEQVVDEKTANQVLLMMEAVLGNEGTGRAARVPGYRVAGKTGTARIAGKNGYEANRHIGSFVGIAPVSNPRFVVAVVIHEPTKNGYYGAQVAAPLFAQVMSAVLRMFEVPPDQVSTS